jgi:hypothetical protein
MTGNVERRAAEEESFGERVPQHLTYAQHFQLGHALLVTT